jgi:branched-chain amino acid transport system substrate-binding protein
MIPFSLFPSRRFFSAIITATAVIALTLSSGCKPSPSTEASATIKVGEYASLTGTEATFGVSSHEGTVLAVEEINKAGGILGKQVELFHEDNRSTAGESVTIVKKFISRDGVVAVLGEVASGRSLEAAPVCQAAGIPMISPSSTNPKVTEIGDYIFRVCFTDPFQGKLISDFAWKALKLKRVAVFSDVSSAYGDGLRQYFSDAFKASGGQIIVEQKYSSKDKDFKAQLTAIKATNPDGICIPGYYNEVGLIVKQARELWFPSLEGTDGKLLNSSRSVAQKL